MVVQGAFGWDGSGTSESPYLIQTTDDWKTLATEVNAGNSYSGQVFRLTKDIDAGGAMVGCYEDMVMHAFSGIFDGDGHTLTFSAGKQGAPVNETTAPFRYVSGATIRHLHTTGEIYTRDWFTAGIVARIVEPGSTQLYDCHSAMQLLIAQGGTMYDGGLVGQVQNMTSDMTVESVVIDRCSFTGALLNRGATGEIKLCGGLVGTIGKNIAVTIRNSIFDPQGWTYYDIVKDGATFASAASAELLTLENCYATYQMTTRQGTFIVNAMTVPDGVTYEFQGEPDVTLNGKGY